MGKRLFLLHLVLLASAATLTVDALLQVTQNTSLCQTQACQAVGTYVRFGEPVLVIFGAIFFWVLWLLVFLASRLSRPFIWKLATLLLVAALAFDGSLLGYQFMGLDMQCLLCVGVGVALALSLFSLAWVRQAGMIAAVGLVVWAGGYAANSILVFSPQSPKLAQTSFVSHSSPKADSKQSGYLFFSLNCGHCTEVVANIALNKPYGMTWNMSSLDGSKKGLRKLAWIRKRAEQGQDPFALTLKAKQKKSVQVQGVPRQVKTAVDKARAFFRNRQYRGVPLLIVRQPNKEIVLTGTESIAQYLWQQGMIKQWVRSEALQSDQVAVHK